MITQFQALLIAEVSANVGILILCTKYPVSIDDSHLTSEIADSLAAKVHKVSIVVLHWEYKNTRIVNTQVFPFGVEVVYFSPRSFKLLGLLIKRIARWSVPSLLCYLKTGLF